MKTEKEIKEKIEECAKYRDKAVKDNNAHLAKRNHFWAEALNWVLED